MKRLAPLLLALALPALTLAPVAQASPAKATKAQCMTETQRAELSRFQKRLEKQDSLEDAQRIADRKLRRAEGVLTKAKGLAPNDMGIEEGMQRAEDMHIRVDAAQTPAEVAAAFDVPAAAPAAGFDCDLTTGETIATVLGFILGILPGIILLILLC